MNFDNVIFIFTGASFASAALLLIVYLIVKGKK